MAKNEERPKIGLIGLGNMGLPIARNILKAGYKLAVYNRTRSRAEPLRAEGAQIADSPAALASGADIVMTMLADDRAVEQVTFQDAGLLNALPAGAIHVSISTISPALSRRLAAAHGERSQGYVSAPVFGRPEAAEAAKLVVMAAGPADAVERCRPVLEAIGRKLFVLGAEAFTANVVKVAGNFMLGSMLETLGEALALVRKAGVDPKQFVEIVCGSLFQSPVYENYGRIIAEKRFEPAGFKVTLGFKDVGLALAAGEEMRVPLPFASMIHDNLLSAIARGRADLDWSALAQIAAENAGLEQHA